MTDQQASPPDAEAVARQLLASIGVRTEHLHALYDQLHSDFSADEGGFRAYRALPLRQRAVVSDQVLGAAQAVITNLAEARMYEQDLGQLLAEGVPFPEPSIEGRERAVRREMAFVGFLRAIGSSLDCFAAVAIGVARLPSSIRRASFNDLINLSDQLANSRRQWAELQRLARERADDPPGWLSWTLEMRNAYMHRPRLLDLLLPRQTEEPRLWLPRWALRQAMRERARFEPHFRRRPWLPDMEHLADRESGDLADVIILEPAIQTVRGIFEATNGLVENVSEFLHEVWVDSATNIPPPSEQWSLESPPQIDFSGFAPLPLPQSLAALVMSPRDAERAKLAERLRTDGGA